MMWPSFLTLSGLLLIAAQVSGSPCPRGFSHYYSHGRPTSVVTYEASCYKFFTDQRTWIDSRRQCKALGGDLVSIETTGEQHHLETIIRISPALQRPALTKFNHWGYWTSGTDAPREGTWTWAATGRPIAYRNWTPGEPNNSFPGGLPENCLQLHQARGWKWNDIICHTDMISYICETKADPIGK